MRKKMNRRTEKISALRTKMSLLKKLLSKKPLFLRRKITVPQLPAKKHFIHGQTPVHLLRLSGRSRMRSPNKTQAAGLSSQRLPARQGPRAITRTALIRKNPTCSPGSTVQDRKSTVHQRFRHLSRAANSAKLRHSINDLINLRRCSLHR